MNTNLFVFTSYVELSCGILQKPSCKKFEIQIFIFLHEWGRRQFERSKCGLIYQVRLLTFYSWCVHFLLCKVVFNALNTDVYETRDLDNQFSSALYRIWWLWSKAGRQFNIQYDTNLNSILWVHRIFLCVIIYQIIKHYFNFSATKRCERIAHDTEEHTHCMMSIGHYNAQWT